MKENHSVFITFFIFIVEHPPMKENIIFSKMINVGIRNKRLFTTL